MTIFIYGAGPITGHTEGNAKDWRHGLQASLLPGIKVISPLRCEPSINGSYVGTYDDPLFGTAQAITSKNKLDVRRCDAVLAYMPLALTQDWPSVGTLEEVGWATADQKPVILVTDNPRLSNHAILSHNVGWNLRTLEQAARLINGLFGDYL